MNARKIVILLAVLAVLVVGIGLVACGGGEEEPAAAPTDTVAVAPTEPAPTEPPPTEPPTEEPSPTSPPPTETPTEEPSPTTAPTDTPEPEAEAELAGAQNCVNCHTDQPTLEELAVVQEVKSEATSGEG